MNILDFPERTLQPPEIHYELAQLIRERAEELAADAWDEQTEEVADWLLDPPSSAVLDRVRDFLLAAARDDENAGLLRERLRSDWIQGNADEYLDKATQQVMGRDE